MHEYDDTTPPRMVPPSKMEIFSIRYPIMSNVVSFLLGAGLMALAEELGKLF